MTSNLEFDECKRLATLLDIPATYHEDRTHEDRGSRYLKGLLYMKLDDLLPTKWCLDHAHDGHCLIQKHLPGIEFMHMQCQLELCATIL